MAQILVTGGGHSGTNLLAALARSFKIPFSPDTEDRKFFFYTRLPEEYGAKLAVENRGYNRPNWIRMFGNNDNLKVGFTIRHPFDMCMSRMRRGQPRSKGGDAGGETYSPDCQSTQHQINSVKKVFGFLDFFQEFDGRLFICKMEDIITNFDMVANSFNSFLDLKDMGDYENFLSYINNRWHGRYGGKIQEDELNKYKNFYEAYDGFFKQKEFNGFLDMMKEQLGDLCLKYGYSQK